MMLPASLVGTFLSLKGKLIISLLLHLRIVLFFFEILIIKMNN